MSHSLVCTLHLWPPLDRAREYRGSSRKLSQLLADHALGCGSRLPKVQLERSGSRGLAQTEPGGTS